jgi:DNA modification methylase
MNDYNLYHNDCLEEMNKISDKSIDMILCDLPYGTTACSWDNVIPFEPLWSQYNRIIKDNGCIALFGSEPFSSYLRMSNIKNYKYDWIWEKSNASGFLNSSYRPLQSHENILIFYKNKSTYNPQMYTINKLSNKTSLNKNGYGSLYSTSKYKAMQTGGNEKRFPRTIIECFSVNSSVNLHPTQKPVTLLEYLIKTYTLENELVLDNTMGSGSTGVACMNTNRNFIGIEKDEKYFNIAKKRIEQSLEGIF